MPQIITNTADLSCNQGTATSKLNVTSQDFVTIEGKAMATDNIMDYSHFVKDPVSGNARSPINRFQLWKWQWETMIKDSDLKPIDNE